MQRTKKLEHRKYTIGKQKSEVHVLLLWTSMKSLLRCLCHHLHVLWQYSPMAVLTQRQSRLEFVECYDEAMIKPRLKERILDLFLSDKRRRQRLLEWIHSRLSTIPVCDFCHSWQDGLALCALLESICPGACPGYRLLLQHNRVKNCRLGLKLANKYLYVPLDLIQPEEMAIADKNTEHKIIQYIFMLKWSSENIKHKWSALHGSLLTAKTGHCFAKGSGLRNGIVGSRLKFNIIVSDTIGIFNLLVEVRGPNNVYSGEQIVSLHQAKGMLDKASARSDPGSSRLDALQYLEDSVGNTFVRKKVRLRQEVDPNDTIFLDCQCGDEGTFHISYIARRAGIHPVSVKWQGHHVDGSPFRVKVYKSSNLSSRNLKGAHEKRVIYDSLSFTSVDGGTSDGNSIQGLNSFDESPPIADAISGERSVGSISKSKAYTMGRQLTVTRRRVLRRIITRNGEDIVIEEAISPSISRQSSFTDNSDEDVRHHLQQKEDGNTKTPMGRKQPSEPSTTDSTREASDQSRDGHKSLGTVLEEQDRQFSVETNENQASLNTEAVTQALNKYMLESRGQTGTESAAPTNDATDPDDGGSDETTIKTKKHYEEQTTIANTCTDSPAAHAPLTSTDDNSTDVDRQAITEAKINSVKRKPLRRAASMRQQTSSTDVDNNNQITPISINNNRKRIANRTSSDGPIYALRRQLSPLLIREPSWSSHSEYSSDDKEATPDYKGRNSTPYSPICPIAPCKQNTDDDLFEPRAAFSPKPGLRETKSLPIQPTGNQSTHDLTHRDDCLSHLDNPETDVNYPTDQHSDTTEAVNYVVKSENPESVGDWREDKAENINVFIWDNTSDNIKGPNSPAHGYRPDDSIRLLSVSFDNDTSLIRHNSDVGHGMFAELKAVHQPLSETTDVNGRSGKTIMENGCLIQHVLHNVDNAVAGDISNDTHMTPSKETNDAEMCVDKCVVVSNVQCEEEITAKQGTIITRFETKVHGVDNTNVIHPTHISEARIMIGPCTDYHNRRNFVRQECRDKGSRESSSIDSDKQAPNSDRDNLDKAPHPSQPNTFRRISEAAQTEKAVRHTSEVHIVIPTAKVDKSTQVTAKEILTATGWDIIEGIYLFMNRLGLMTNATRKNITPNKHEYGDRVIAIEEDKLRTERGAECGADNNAEYILPRRMAIPDILTTNMHPDNKGTDAVYTQQQDTNKEIEHIGNVNAWFKRNELIANKDGLIDNRPHLEIQETDIRTRMNNIEVAATTTTINYNSSDDMKHASTNEYNVMQCHIPQKTLAAQSMISPDMDKHTSDRLRWKQLTSESNDSGCFESAPRLSWPLIVSDNGHIRLFRQPYRGRIILDRKLVTSSLESMDEESETDYELSSLEYKHTPDRITRRRHKFQYRDDSFSLSDSELDLRSRTRTRRRMVRRSRQKSSNTLNVDRDERTSYTDGDSNNSRNVTNGSVGHSEEICEVKDNVTDKSTTDPSTNGVPNIIDGVPMSATCSSTNVFSSHSIGHPSLLCNGNSSPVKNPSSVKDDKVDESPVGCVQSRGEKYRSLASISIDSSYSGFGLSKPMRMDLLSEIDEFKHLDTSQDSSETSTEMDGTANINRIDAASHITAVHEPDDIEHVEPEMDEIRCLYVGREKRLSWADVDKFDYYSAVELEDETSGTGDSDNYSSEPIDASIKESRVSENGYDDFPVCFSESFDMFNSFDKSCVDHVDVEEEGGSGVGERSDNDGFLEDGIKVAGSGLTCGHVDIKNCFQIWMDHPATLPPTVTIIGPQPHAVRETSVLYTGDNLYEVLYKVTRPGLYQVFVKVLEKNVANSPYICEVTY